MSHGNRLVLVTGAGGFIGSRVVERLRMALGDSGVRALVHRPAGAVQVSRYGIEIHTGEMTDERLVGRVVEGASAVVHCAYDPVNSANNSKGADTLARACIQFGVENLVHLSSLSVYEPLGDQLVTESSDTVASGWTYPDTKLEVEQRFLRWHEQEGLPVVILQPTMVYGPFSGTWTEAVARQLRRFRVVLPGDGSGLCHPVFIDDAVDAIMRALAKESLGGRRFLITGTEPVTWRDFYGAYEAALGTHSVEYWPIEELQARVQKPVSAVGIKTAIRDPARVLQRAAPNWARGYAIRRIPRVSSWIQRSLPVSYRIPDAHQLALYTSKAHVSGEAARLGLGYVPKTAFSDGIAISAEYLRWANL